MNGKSLSFSVAPGYEGFLERYLGRDASNRDWFLEAGCWGFNNWVSTAVALSTGQITTSSPFGPVTHGSLESPFQGRFPGLDGADVLNARYNSSLNSAEINLWVRPRSSPDRLVLHPDGSWHRECQPGLYTSFLVGFRYLNLDEQFHLHGSGTYLFDATGQTEVLAGDYYVNTRNNMYGFQLGAELMERDCRWEYGFRFKVAPLINVVEGSSQLTTNNPYSGSTELPPWVTATHIAADIDLGAVATYKIHPNVAIKAGYDIAWLTGVGLAPEQVRNGSNIASLLQSGSPQTPNTHGTLFYQGLTLGLTWMR